MLFRFANCAQHVATLVFVVIFSGCVKSPVSRPQNFKPLTHETASDVQTKEQVTAFAKRLNLCEQQALFGGYACKLNENNIVPLQLTLENSSAINWELHEAGIALDRLKIDYVNQKLFRLRRWRPLLIFGCGLAAAFIVTPAIIAGLAGLYAVTCPCCIFLPFLYCSGLIFTTSTCAAIGDGIATHISKKRMREYLKSYCKESSISVNSGMTMSLLFFVEKSKVPSELSFLLIDDSIENHTLNFQLSLGCI